MPSRGTGGDEPRPYTARDGNGRAQSQERPSRRRNRPLSLLQLAAFSLHRLLTGLVGGGENCLFLFKDLSAYPDRILNPVFDVINEIGASILGVCREIAETSAGLSASLWSE